MFWLMFTTVIVLIVVYVAKNMHNGDKSLDDFLENEVCNDYATLDYKYNPNQNVTTKREYRIHDEYTLYYYSVPVEYISEVSRPELRALPFLTDNSQLVSNDNKTFTYKKLFAKPDLIVKDGNFLYFCEIKSKRMYEYDDYKVWKHLLQVVVSAYCYHKSHDTEAKDIKVYLRYLDCYVEIPCWEQFSPYISFAHNIYLHNVKDEVASADLANFIGLICNDISERPRTEAEHVLKGLGVHGMFAYEGAIPKLLSPVE